MSPTEPTPALAADQRLLPLTIADLERVMAIEVGAYSFPWSRGNFIDSMATGHLMEKLVLGDDTIAGYFVAMPGVDELHLLNLTIAPRFQGHGHARTMLRALQARASARALSTLWLEVRVGNERALHLYRRWGFIQQGVRRGYYPAGSGQREDAVVMSLNVGRSPVTREEHGLD